MILKHIPLCIESSPHTVCAQQLIINRRGNFYFFGLSGSILPDVVNLPSVSPSSAVRLLLRDVLRLPGGDQDPDEDGPEHGAGGPRQLPAGSPGAWRGAAAHQPAPAGAGHGVRRVQRVRHDLRPRGAFKDLEVWGIGPSFTVVESNM